MVVAFWTILREIILPIALLTGIGFVLQRKFQLDMYTLAKLNLYFIVPGIMFINLYETTFSLEVFVYVFLFFVLSTTLLYAVAALAARLFRLNRVKSRVTINGALLQNSGNYGIPVNNLVFHGDPFGASIQIWIMTLQNMFTFTYGVFVMQKKPAGFGQVLLQYVKMPVFFALVLGLGFNLGNVALPNFVLIPIRYIGDAMVAVALFTLGAQVANLKWNWKIPMIYLSTGIRLIVSPIIAYIIVVALQLEGILAQSLLISSAMPTSVNSAILSQEYNYEPELAAQVVTVSTCVSVLTVTLVIYFAQQL